MLLGVVRFKVTGTRGRSYQSDIAIDDLSVGNCAGESVLLKIQSFRHHGSIIPLLKQLFDICAHKTEDELTGTSLSDPSRLH